MMEYQESVPASEMRSRCILRGRGVGEVMAKVQLLAVGLSVPWLCDEGRGLGPRPDGP